MNGSTQIGNAIGSLSTTVSATYTFTPSPKISLAAGQQYVVDVYADVLTGASNTGVAYSSIILDSVTATGISTNSDASDTSTDPAGQNIYLATSGSLTLAAASDMPVAQNRAMGETGQTLATFKLTAGPEETVNVSQVILTDTVSGSTTAATGSVTNLKLFRSDGTQVGSTVASMASNAKATFSGISNLNIAKDQSEILTLKGDVNSYPNAVSNSGHAFSIASSTTDVTVIGGLSGQSISASGTPSGNAQRVYRAELTVANAMSNMTGGAGTGQQIGKYKLTNTSPGNYSITVADIDIGLSSTIDIASGTTRTVSLYKNSISSANLLATKGFTGTASAGEMVDITSWAATMTSFTIDASNGSGSVDIIITADTNDAAAAKSISTSIGTGSNVITWQDGQTTGITNLDGTPIYGASVSY